MRFLVVAAISFCFIGIFVSTDILIDTGHLEPLAVCMFGAISLCITASLIDWSE